MNRKLFYIITCLALLWQALLNNSPFDSLAGAALGESVELHIIMYHELHKSPRNMWEITPAEFEADLIYLRDNGYTAVFMQDIIDYVYEGTPLPDKPIILTVDDGTYSTMSFMLPLLEQYNTKASWAIIGKETDKYTTLKREENIKRYPHVNWDDVNVGLASGFVEIICHSYDLHGKNGAGKLSEESNEEYKSRLMGDLAIFDKALLDNTGLVTKSFAYPLGVISETSDDVLKEAGYLASLSCHEKINKITVGDRDCLYGLNRCIRPPRKSLSSILKKG